MEGRFFIGGVASINKHACKSGDLLVWDFLRDPWSLKRETPEDPVFFPMQKLSAVTIVLSKFVGRWPHD